VTIRHGRSGRDKTVQVGGVETRIVLQRLGLTS
jgi:uncharacterized protein YggU (UPF0235/DUF167 family)